ncbi:VaFE repeat-containing surface-anchored protein [Corynebacterium aurimucosum]
MSKLRNISREGWMVLTAVFTAIAVIAAMVTVPWAKANAAEPTDFVPNMTLGAQAENPYVDYSWGELVWAGKPPRVAGNAERGNEANDVGWAWCIDTTLYGPMNTYGAYKAETAGKAPIPEGFRDAAINLAVKLRDATEREDKGAASRYSVYLAAVLGADQKNQTAAVLTITGEDRAYKAPGGHEWYPNFNGSPEEFKQLTGYGIETFRITDDYGFETDDYGFEFVADPTVDIPAAPADSFITIVGPDGNLERGDLDAQRVMPPDQPGLPDDEGESVEPSIGTQAKFAEGSTQVVAGAQVNDTVKYEGLVPGKEYALNAELISKEDGKTVLGEGQETFTPDAANGEVVVEITVDESVTEPVEAAVAFEELTSVEVNDKGEETPDATPENPNHIAEHKDINDKAQTVPNPDEETTPNTPGDETTPNTTEKTTEPGDETCESTTPSKPGEETTPNEPGELWATPPARRISTSPV